MKQGWKGNTKQKRKEISPNFHLSKTAVTVLIHRTKDTLETLFEQCFFLS